MDFDRFFKFAVFGHIIVWNLVIVNHGSYHVIVHGALHSM